MWVWAVLAGYQLTSEFKKNKKQMNGFLHGSTWLCLVRLPEQVKIVTSTHGWLNKLIGTLRLSQSHSTFRDVQTD